MTAYADLSPWDYYEVLDDPQSFKAVGWLGRDVPFNTGPVSREFYWSLLSLSRNPLPLVCFCGAFGCEFCQFDVPMGSGEIFVPGDGVIFVAPVLIEHYIATHFYLPPQEFIAAVLQCPNRGSINYIKAFLDNGGRELVRGLRDRPRHRS